MELIRDDDDWRENYMTIEMKMDQKYEQGKTEGEQDKGSFVKHWKKKQ